VEEVITTDIGQRSTLWARVQ